ncbi:PPOX class F420-dependent oxidoreductase [Lentzea californiensis]|uniref:PPOX class F420-dependent oxidoreductase n=1 Tax=Lentzea californiensis TaxID=438851 RepID=UPI002166501E|nr:PPOX class F420-dependent oxidoreductase [Lentzea californiensis]MCR3752951.1 pyridoxamine 5'-phosphate oxidase family protein [Lentzea californiensis]
MFTDEEIAYLREQPLARLATVNEDGWPDVVPLAFECDGTHIWVGGAGDQVRNTRKFRNITAGRRQVSLVVDDLVSFTPFVARAIRIYGIADDPAERTGIVGPGVYSRITPTRVWAWNMAGEPAGETWYEPRRS